jgi:hypothetical protein
VNVPNSFKITYRLFRGDTSGTDPLILGGKVKLLALPFLVQAIYQHVQAYAQLMDMQDDIPIEELLPFSDKLKEVLGH